jgi:hypothetical protein
MKLENWQMSYDKWNPATGVLSELNKPGKIDWGRVRNLLDKDCGHCEECSPDCQQRAINERCTLKGVNNRCGGGRGRADHYFTLEKMAGGYIPRNKRKARRIATRIFKQILKDDPRRGE